ncbi:MAG TPA: MBL fold metallo-hydrolase [Nitrolancea sp.]|nr:MBL fold metallo-hydrolase [Nitrolancea sp.]
MAGQSTNAYLVGERELLIVDPGSEPGVALIQEALAARAGVPVRAIVLTHAHPDHAQAAVPLKRLLGVPLLLHPGNQPILGRSLTWDEVDQELADGMVLEIDGGRLEAVLTPGHAPGHIALFEPSSGTLLAGDLVSGNGTVGIFPPHGSMVEYLASLARARALGVGRILPGHGPAIPEGAARLDEYIEHRLNREREVYERISRQPATIEAIVIDLYPDVLPQFRRAAGATVLAHLQKLQGERSVRPEHEAEPFTTIWRAT